MINPALQTAGRAAFWVATVSAVAVALVSFRFLPLGVGQAMDFVAHNLKGNSVVLYAHIGVAPIALALMPFQFMARLRSRRPAMHRWMGRAYVGAILVSGLAGFQLAFHSTAGPIASAGFALLAVLWLGTTFLAVVHALRHRFALHRIWMLRSAALTFAAVTLRVYLGSAMALEMDFSVAYPVIAWLCWVPNALVMEIYVRVRGERSYPSGSVAAE